MTGLARWLPTRVEDYPAWLASLHNEAARRLAVTPLEQPTPSASYGVCGGRVRQADGALAWLRVAPFDESGQDHAAWMGTREAAAIAGVRKPELLATVEWTDKQHVATPVSGELMTLVTDPVIQPGDQYLDHDPGLPDAWFTDMRASQDALAAHPTDRTLWWHGPQRSGYAIHAAYGELPPISPRPGGRSIWICTGGRSPPPPAGFWTGNTGASASWAPAPRVCCSPAWRSHGWPPRCVRRSRTCSTAPRVATPSS